MMTMRLKEQFVSVWRICEDCDTLAHLLCPRNVLLLSQSRHAAAKVWMCLAGLVVHLLSCGVLQPDSLEQQCIALLQSTWPQVCNVILMQPRTLFHQMIFKWSIRSYWMILILVGWLKHEGGMGVIGIINWPTTWNKLLLEKLLVVSLGKKLPASYGTWWFFTILTQACLWRILNKLNPVHILLLYFFKIHYNIIMPSLSRSSRWSLQVIQPKIYFPSYDNTKKFRQREHIMKLLVI